MKKKVFSLMLALLLCLPGLAANAATKTSADFSDLKDLDAATKAKFDAMISAGIFDGVSDTTFGLKDEMNRAQFAKVAALIYGLKVDSSLKTSSFSDVKSDDPANGYALPYIEAIKKAGITDGTGDGKFSPAGDVTKEQLAAFLVKGLGQKEEAEATPGVKDDTVSDWAKGYVALALEKKLLTNGADGKFGGSTNATRDLLVTGAYEAKNEFVAQEKKKEEEEKKKKEEEEKKNNPPIYNPPAPSPAGTPTASVSGGSPIVSGTTISVASGTTITLTSSNFDTIYYTTDGSDPATSSYRHTYSSAGIIITTAGTIKAIAVKSGSANSAVFTATFEIDIPESPPPLIESVFKDVFASTGELYFVTSVTGTVYYSVVSATYGSVPTTPTVDKIIDGVDSNNADAFYHGHKDVTSYDSDSFIVDDVTDGTYYFYLVVFDADGNESPIKVESVIVGDGGRSVFCLANPSNPVCVPEGGGGGVPSYFEVTDLSYEGNDKFRITFSQAVDEDSLQDALVMVVSQLTLLDGDPPTVSPPTLISSTIIEITVGDGWYAGLEDGDIINIDITGIRDDATGTEIDDGRNSFELEKPYN